MVPSMQTSPNVILASRTFDTLAQSPWDDPPDVGRLTSDNVTVWIAALDIVEGAARRFGDCLSPDERARADRFQSARDRERFVVRRGVLRTILGWYVGIGPERLRFEYNPYGKPSLAGQTGMEPIRFNLTNSGGLALIAVTRGREVGVDVERLNTQFDALEVAERFFSPLEATGLRGLPTAAQKDACLRCWTRKEAYLKARGLGVTWPLDRFDVSVSPDHAALLNVCDEPEELSRWSMHNLNPEPGYVGALVIEGRG